MMRELKTLVAVAREGTFAAAGEKIGLTQAAVSAQMQRLQSDLGLQLFDREGRSARLNKMGLQILHQAEELIRLYEQLGTSTIEAPTSIVNVGAIASAQRGLLPDALAKFHRLTPGCRSRVIPGLSIELLNMVDAGAMDMAIMIRPPFSLHSDLRWTTLLREPFRLIVPRRIQGDDWRELMMREPFVRYDRSSFGGRQVDRFLKNMRIQPRDICEVDELEALVKLVGNGVGIALLPQTYAYRKWPRAVRAIDLGEDTFHREIGLVHGAKTKLTAPARDLASMIGDAAQAMR